jgi:hypothetical protein
MQCELLEANLNKIIKVQMMSNFLALIFGLDANRTQNRNKATVEMTEFEC